MIRNLVVVSAMLIAPLASTLGPAVAAEADGGTDGLAAQMTEGPETARWGYAPQSSVLPTGQTITWTNTGQAPHTATDDGGAWDTGLVSSGGIATLTFATPGTYFYHCALHPWMKGTVVVADAAPNDGAASATQD